MVVMLFQGYALRLVQGRPSIRPAHRLLSLVFHLCVCASLGDSQVNEARNKELGTLQLTQINEANKSQRGMYGFAI